jgi:hypothetical protein
MATQAIPPTPVATFGLRPIGTVYTSQVYIHLYLYITCECFYPRQCNPFPIYIHLEMCTEDGDTFSGIR